MKQEVKPKIFINGRYLSQQATVVDRKWREAFEATDEWLVRYGSPFSCRRQLIRLDDSNVLRMPIDRIGALTSQAQPKFSTLSWLLKPAS